MMESVKSFFKKNVMAVVSGVILIACSVYYFIDMGQKQFLQSKSRDLTVDHARILKNLKYGSNLNEDLGRAKVLLEEAEGRLFHEIDLASNYNYFFKLESETGVTLSGLRQLPRQPEAKGKQRKQPSVYQKIAYTMNASGTFEQLLDFMRHLEGGKAFYRLVRIAMGPSGSSVDKDRLELNITLSILGHIE